MEQERCPQLERASALQHERLGRPCLLFHIEKCAGPCVGEIDHEAYDRLVADLAAISLLELIEAVE